MLTSLALLAASSSSVQAAPVKLGRRFTAGEKLTYSVKAAYTSESREGELLTFVPQDYEQSYGFTLEVGKLKPDGIADALYKRPTFTFTIGDTAERGPVATTTKTNQRYRMTLASINEVLNVTDETPKKSPAKGAIPMRASQQADGAVAYFIGQFLGEIQSLSFFTGGFESSLDIAPRLPFEAVRPGDTWLRTVGYSPQKLKGKGSKQAVQRLDYTYKYEGIVQSRGKKVHRVTATLAVKTDLADFAKQLTESLGRTIIEKAPTQLDAKILFDLDLKTFHTLRADATSTNSVGVFLKGMGNPIQEERARGTTTLTLISRTIPVISKKSR